MREYIYILHWELQMDLRFWLTILESKLGLTDKSYLYALSLLKTWSIHTAR